MREGGEEGGRGGREEGEMVRVDWGVGMGLTGMGSSGSPPRNFQNASGSRP